MPNLTANGISLAYEDHGDPSAPPVLMIMGLGGQLSLWPDKLIADFVAGGYRVITFDNRDIGLSHQHTDERAPKICLLYTSPSPRDQRGSRMPSSA